jgi:hypothetical protein
MSYPNSSSYGYIQSAVSRSLHCTMLTAFIYSMNRLPPALIPYSLFSFIFSPLLFPSVRPTRLHPLHTVRHPRLTVLRLPHTVQPGTMYCCCYSTYSYSALHCTESYCTSENTIMPMISHSSTCTYPYPYPCPCLLFLVSIFLHTTKRILYPSFNAPCFKKSSLPPLSPQPLLLIIVIITITITVIIIIITITAHFLHLTF